MAIQVSKASLDRAHGRIETLMHKISKVRKEGEHMMEKVLRTGETVGTAFGFGLLNGYHGPVTIAKIPLEVVVGGLAELGGFFGLAGKHSDHLNNIGDGALSAFAVVKGVQVGAELKAKHGGGAGAAAPAQISSTKGVTMTPDEIRATIQEAVAQQR